MAICDCCGLEVADLEMHYPCECKECFRRLWLVSFVCANHVETHIAAKVVFEAEKYTITYIDGSTTFMQADTINSFTIQPFKVGTFKRMSPAEREKVVATGYDTLARKGQVSEDEILRQADAVATAIHRRATSGPLPFFINYFNGIISGTDGNTAMALAAAFPQEWNKYLKITQGGKQGS
jgi:hypothetical protein